MKSNNEIFCCEIPYEWTTLKKTMTSNGKSSPLPVKCWPLLHVIRGCSWWWSDVVAGISARFSKFAFVSCCYITKSFNDWSRRKQWIFFPLNSVEILEKQNPLFPSGQVIYCWMFCSRPQNWLGYYAPPFISVVVFVRSILRMASSALSDAFLSSYTNFLLIPTA